MRLLYKKATTPPRIAQKETFAKEIYKKEKESHFENQKEKRSITARTEAVRS